TSFSWPVENGFIIYISFLCSITDNVGIYAIFRLFFLFGVICDIWRLFLLYASDIPERRTFWPLFAVHNCGAQAR
ncbi:MAG: hypothetical protein WDA41_04880, partial [Candidatus Neomarinimicrobiota bacterium]